MAQRRDDVQNDSARGIDESGGIIDHGEGTVAGSDETYSHVPMAHNYGTDAYYYSAQGYDPYYYSQAAATTGYYPEQYTDVTVQYQQQAAEQQQEEAVPATTATPKAKGKVAEVPKRKKFIREGGGIRWEDPSLANWPKGDFRLFAGNLGNDVTDESLRAAFSKYKSCTMAHVVRDKRTGKTKGYGFVSFMDPHEFVKALKEMNGKYIGGRPCKLTKSRWEDRNIESEKRKKKRAAMHHHQS